MSSGRENDDIPPKLADAARRLARWLRKKRHTGVTIIRVESGEGGIRDARPHREDRLEGSD